MNRPRLLKTARSAQKLASISQPDSELERAWWQEIEVAFLITLVVGIYFTRLTALPIRGEESRRGCIARTMLQSGDWIVPRVQGEPFLSRPPLGNWLIALAASLRGQCDLVALRLPSVLATLAATLLVYGYSRLCLSRLGALAAGAAFATMAQVMELGRLAETESVFTLLVSSSLLIWHWGYLRAWRATSTWVAGYALAALAALTKGPQAPVYFTGSIGLFLLINRNLRFCFSRGHLAGVLTFLLLVGAWQVPFWHMLGWQAVRQIWISDASLRFVDHSLPTIVKHLATYPIEIVLCTGPWSVLLIFFVSRGFRQAFAGRGSCGMFLATCLTIAFASCWFVPGAQSRYLMPLYPCLGPLIGLVIQSAVELAGSSGVRRLWQWILTIVAVTLGTSALLVLAASYLSLASISFLQQPPWFAAGYAVAAVAAACLIQASRNSQKHSRGQVGLLASAAMLGLVSTGLVINYLARKSEDVAPLVSLVKERVARAELTPLVSFGPVEHRFIYLYDAPIELRAWPSRAADWDHINYFCFTGTSHQPVYIPVPWERIAEISCDRFRSPEPRCAVIVGRRLLPTEPGYLALRSVNSMFLKTTSIGIPP
jgi:4-amino-4-deoxy-L-arabinose transferase-like glycosyltransferase